MLIGRAARSAWEAEQTARREQRGRALARRRVVAVDEVLEALELQHLARERTIDRLLRARLRRLEEEVGLPLPRKVVRARNSVRLHAALLDWQEAILDEVAPWRRAFPDLHQLAEGECLELELQPA